MQITIEQAEPRWYGDHRQLVELAYWMNEKGMFKNADEVIYFFEKPWKYEDKWDEYKNGVV